MVHKSTRLCILIFIFSCTGTVLYANSTVPYAFFLIMHRYTCIPCTQSAQCVTMIFVSISTQGDPYRRHPLSTLTSFFLCSRRRTGSGIWLTLNVETWCFWFGTVPIKPLGIRFAKCEPRGHTGKNYPQPTEKKCNAALCAHFGIPDSDTLKGGAGSSSASAE